MVGKGENGAAEQTRRPNYTRARLAALAGASLLSLHAQAASAQTAAAVPPVEEPQFEGVPDIIVTATKREQAVNNVAMSITAATGEQLATRGVAETRDLTKIVPGFTYAESNTASPIYTLRGIGYGDVSIGGRPTVSTYNDEAPLPFSIETKGTGLDLERVEVLKGPQGTLFGQNATGGAINFIAAKPTNTFAAGADISYGRFNSLDASAFVSGPVTDTLNIRVAGQHRGSGDWQKSFTRNDSLGRSDFNNGRFLADWRPSNGFRAQLNVNAWSDQSDTQAVQLIAVRPQVPGAAAIVPGLLTQPTAPANARAADWTPGLKLERNNRFFQSNLRLDVDVANDIQLTSLTSYSHYKGDEFNDLDGSTLRNFDVRRFGKIDTFYQELRLSADLTDRLHLLVGGTFESDKTKEDDFVNLSDSTQGYFVVGFGLPRFRTLHNIDYQNAHTWAAFASADFKVTSTVTVSGGIRYTDYRNRFQGASLDAGDGNIASVFNPLYNIIRGGAGLGPLSPPIAAGGSATLNDNLVPVIVNDTLRENNVSWRANVEWRPTDGVMLYANVNKGYKAGSFPITGATRSTTFKPATQESVLAYEAGFKAKLFDRKLQLNGAAFYYDYRDKQIQGRVLDPFLGGLFRLTNIPKSRIAGAELQATLVPVRGLTVGAGLSYIDSKILGSFTNFDPFNNVRNFRGEAFPNTPKWQFSSDVDYKFAISDRNDAFLGGGVTVHSRTNSALGEQPILAVDGYALVDLRAGLESRDGTWRASVWGRNVTNKYYWVSATYIDDAVARVAGRPATCGVTLALRFK